MLLFRVFNKLIFVIRYIGFVRNTPDILLLFNLTHTDIYNLYFGVDWRAFIT